jgi:SAM-dependent methyltransferase
MSGWQLADSSAEAYERWLVPPIFSGFADDLVAVVEPGCRVLDVACGTGIVARRAAELAGSVIGVDINRQMLEVARAREPSIEWIEADAADLPLPDDSVDCVLCQQGLQFFADPDQALREMARVLAPGGRLALSVWRSIEGSPVYARLADLLDPDDAAIMRSPFSGPDADQLRAMVGADAHVRISIKTVRFPSSDELLWREVASSPMSVTVDSTLQSAFAAAIRPYIDDDGVAFPMETNVVRAQ